MSDKLKLEHCRVFVSGQTTYLIELPGEPDAMLPHTRLCDYEWVTHRVGHGWWVSGRVAHASASKERRPDSGPFQTAQEAAAEAEQRLLARAAARRLSE